MFSAVAIAQLVELGRLAFKDPIGNTCPASQETSLTLRSTSRVPTRQTWMTSCTTATRNPQVGGDCHRLDT
jgi:hypothetical protein